MIGTGYVGLVSGACFADLGNTVWCVDKIKEKINMLNNKKIPIYEPGLEELVKKNHKSGRLKFTTNLKLAVQKSELIFICVGTPTSKNGSADLKYVFNVAKEISRYINKFKIIINKSTVPVSTGDKVEKIISIKNKKNKFAVISNPEFLREGDAIRDFRFPDRIVIGSNNKKILRKIENLYKPLINKGAVFFTTSRRGAEIIKYASNAFLATKISFMNEIGNLCEKANVDVEDVALGIGLDKRVGPRFLRVGPAYGGSCFPKDTKAIVFSGDKLNTNLSIIKSVIKSNDDRKILLLKRAENILSGKIKNKNISFLGVTFKANTDDMRGSTSSLMIPLLHKKGAQIRYYDPTGAKKEFSKLKNVSYCDNISKACINSDLIIIHTEWDEFKSLNFKKLSKRKNCIIFDMRNLYSPTEMNRLRLKYYSIGR